jgi:hypothetical protein
LVVVGGRVVVVGVLHRIYTGRKIKMKKKKKKEEIMMMKGERSREESM